MMKYLRSQILGFRAISHPPHHVRIHPLEIIFVKLRKARRILLRRLDQKPLVRLAFFVPSRQSLQTDSPRGVVLHRDNGCGQGKVTEEKREPYESILQDICCAVTEILARRRIDGTDTGPSEQG